MLLQLNIVNEIKKSNSSSVKSYYEEYIEIIC